MSLPRVGVAMLDTRFPRLPGDIGCPETFKPSALIERVDGARVADAVTGDRHDDDLINGFVDAARRLHDRGADIVVTSCGFLSPLQEALEQAVPVPVVSSVLIDLPEIRRQIRPSAAIGILTFDSRKLGSTQLPDEAGPYQTAGLEGNGELYTVISNDQQTLDRSAAEFEVLTMGKELTDTYRTVEIIVLECTNLPPYQDRLAEVTGIPVYSLRDAVEKRIRMLVD